MPTPEKNLNFMDFPSEILLQVLGYLSLCDLVKCCSRLNRRFAEHTRTVFRLKIDIASALIKKVIATYPRTKQKNALIVVAKDKEDVAVACLLENSQKFFQDVIFIKDIADIEDIAEAHPAIKKVIHNLASSYVLRNGNLQTAIMVKDRFKIITTKELLECFSKTLRKRYELSSEKLSMIPTEKLLDMLSSENTPNINALGFGQR